MRRHTARSLLLVMLMGILAPSALAVLAAPAHACCLRKKSHCHSSRPAEELTFHAANCGQHDCCRALPATHSAKPDQLGVEDVSLVRQSRSSPAWAKHDATRSARRNGVIRGEALHRQR